MTYPELVEPADLFSMKGRTVLITGASRGIGARFARVLDAAGAHVVLVARGRDRLESLAGELRNEAFVVSADLSRPETAAEVAAEALRQAGKIDVLINNASVSDPALALETSREDWQRLLDLNLTSAFELAKGLVPGMLERRWGRVINVASVLAFRSGVQAASYSASKAGTLGMTRALAIEWARSGVTANTLCPGWIDTEMVADLKSNEAFNTRVHTNVPAGRWGQPEDLDGAVLFLASDASRFMTGADLIVDGGLMVNW